MFITGGFRAAALAAAIGAAAVPALPPGPVVMQPAVSAKRKRALFSGAVLPSGEPLVGRKPAGISMAQQKRAAIKKRGVARNRRHHK